MHHIILTILLGILAGLLGGSLGTSGAIIIIPGLLILGIISDFKIAIGTVLLSILPPLSLLAVIEYYKRKQINVPISITLMISYFFAAYIGARLTKDVPDTVLEYMSGVLYLLVSAFFFINAYTGHFKKNK